MGNGLCNYCDMFVCVCSYVWCASVWICSLAGAPHQSDRQPSCGEIAPRTFKVRRCVGAIQFGRQYMRMCECLYMYIMVPCAGIYLNDAAKVSDFRVHQSLRLDDSAPSHCTHSHRGVVLRSSIVDCSGRQSWSVGRRFVSPRPFRFGDTKSTPFAVSSWAPQPTQVRWNYIKLIDSWSVVEHSRPRSIVAKR